MATKFYERQYENLYKTQTTAICFMWAFGIAECSRNAAFDSDQSELNSDFWFVQIINQITFFQTNSSCSQMKSSHVIQSWFKSDHDLDLPMVKLGGTPTKRKHSPTEGAETARAADLTAQLLNAADDLSHITTIIKVDSLKQTCLWYTIRLTEVHKSLNVLHL